jgi:hypothetical protein
MTWGIASCYGFLLNYSPSQVRYENIGFKETAEEIILRAETPESGYVR